MIEQYAIGSIVGITQSLVGHPLDTLKVFKQNKISKKLDFRGYYRGIKYPTCISTFQNSILFGNYNQFNKEIDNKFVSGFMSGFIIGIIISPFELFKTQSQTLKKDKVNFFRGMPLTIMRESIASGFYFSTYYYLKDKNYHPLISGGLSGWLSWLSTYPIDTVKTRIQTDINITYLSAIKQRNLWNGFAFCSYRAILVNSIGFVIFEKLNSYI